MLDYILARYVVCEHFGQVDLEHLCEFWWSFMRCQKDARRARSGRCTSCVDQDTPARDRIFAQITDSVCEGPWAARLRR